MPEKKFHGGERGRRSPAPSSSKWVSCFAGAVRKNGALVGCMPIDVQGFTANQELGRVLLDDECDG